MRFWPGPSSVVDTLERSPPSASLSNYAQEEGQRAGLGQTFTAVLPRLTPHTELGRPAVQAYAARSGQSEEDYLKSFGKPLTPEAAGVALVELVRKDPASTAREYLLTGDGLRPLPA